MKNKMIAISADSYKMSFKLDVGIGKRANETHKFRKFQLILFIIHEKIAECIRKSK